MSVYILNEDICPSLSTDELTKLSEVKINSVIDLLLCDLSKIRSISRNKDIDFEKLLETKKLLYKRFGPKKLNAFQSIYTSKDESYKTGIERLDEMLVNGIKSGEITEVFGYPCSGKSQFCYTFALNFIQNYKKKVLFIDTDLSFASERVEQIMKHHKNIMEKDWNQIISSIKVIKALKISSILNTFETISNDLKTNPESEFKDIGLVIVDNLTTPLTIEFKSNLSAAEEQQIERINSSKAFDLRFRSICVTTQIANTLTAFASEHSMVVIAVNSQSVALKNNWKNFCKLSLNFYDRNKTEKESHKELKQPKDSFEGPKCSYKGITITRSDDNIENKSNNDFKIGIFGFY